MEILDSQDSTLGRAPLNTILIKPKFSPFLFLNHLVSITSESFDTINLDSIVFRKSMSGDIGEITPTLKSVSITHHVF